MTDNIELLSAFNDKSFVETIARDLFVPPSDSATMNAMRFMYTYMKDEIPHKAVDIIKHKSISAETTIEQTSFRYSLYTELAEEFPLFKNACDKDGLVTALICGPYLDFADMPAGFHEDGEMVDKPQTVSGIDFDTLLRAIQYHADAIRLELQGTPNGIEEAKPEAIFLMHVNVFDSLRSVEEALEDSASLEEDDLNDLEEALYESLDPVWKYFQYDSEIGKAMLHSILAMREDLKNLKNPAPQSLQAANLNNTLRPIN